MSYFDIFRIEFNDLKIIADHPESIITRIIKTDSGYIGEIVLLGEYPDRESNILFFHDESFETEREAANDLYQIIETVTRASESTRISEALRKRNLSE
ncbi:hypothetical protein ACFP1I_27740 [Dyadobacter subterraneus]|uniref:DUF4926 domain-containing protein n=1 Tax=Dyadobacter subterraneus TaxID=2773304 RepID=A0ABR9WCL9_9BACT|nr:hypothetical protein [Dyadobacter subterraneus]MBE9463157.1 hypothetical protein [Dyadobacter subterraneus]